MCPKGCTPLGDNNAARATHIRTHTKDAASRARGRSMAVSAGRCNRSASALVMGFTVDGGPRR